MSCIPGELLDAKVSAVISRTPEQVRADRSLLVARRKEAEAALQEEVERRKRAVAELAGVSEGAARQRGRPDRVTAPQESTLSQVSAMMSQGPSERPRGRAVTSGHGSILLEFDSFVRMNEPDSPGQAARMMTELGNLLENQGRITSDSDLVGSEPDIGMGQAGMEFRGLPEGDPSYPIGPEDSLYVPDAEEREAAYAAAFEEGMFLDAEAFPDAGDAYDPEDDESGLVAVDARNRMDAGKQYDGDVFVTHRGINYRTKSRAKRRREKHLKTLDAYIYSGALGPSGLSQITPASLCGRPHWGNEDLARFYSLVEKYGPNFDLLQIGLPGHTRRGIMALYNSMQRAKSPRLEGALRKFMRSPSASLLEEKQRVEKLKRYLAERRQQQASGTPSGWLNGEGGILLASQSGALSGSSDALAAAEADQRARNEGAGESIAIPSAENVRSGIDEPHEPHEGPERPERRAERRVDREDGHVTGAGGTDQTTGQELLDLRGPRQPQEPGEQREGGEQQDLVDQDDAGYILELVANGNW